LFSCRRLESIQSAAALRHSLTFVRNTSISFANKHRKSACTVVSVEVLSRWHSLSILIQDSAIVVVWLHVWRRLTRLTKSGKKKRKRNVLRRRCLNVMSDRVEVTCDGRLFLKLAPETGKARLPTVERLNGGTASWLKDADRSLCRMARHDTGEVWRWCNAVHSSVGH